MIRRFIERPVLSTVISIIIVILGFLGYNALPVSLYPEIAPPTIQVSANYPGANAETVLNSVVTPLEEQINGVEGMTYISSTASDNGRAQIQVFFELGTDPDIAAVNVQNRVAQASSLLPQEVTQAGVTTQKQQTSRLLIFTLYSPNGKYDGTFIENYARINVIPQLQRINGVGTAESFGNSAYAMRIWMKPDVMASYNLTPNDVIAALNEQSFVAAPGTIGENSGQAFQYTLKYKGRLSTVPEYEDIIIRGESENGEILRFKDVADVELGSQSYTVNRMVNGGPGAGISISKTADANAQEVVENVKAELEKASQSFPDGIEYTTVFDANSFLTASIDKVFVTFFEAFALVFIVVFVFLQDWRSTLIPAIAVPVSIIGTFFFLNLFGYSVNLLTLFALVLAIGIVVDDAIIVVEIIHAKLEEGADSGMEAAVDGMNEIAGAIVSITLVMSAIFIPVTFITGSTGVFFQQFGITLATAIIISAVNALTLSPALCALVLKPEHKHVGEEKTLTDRFAIAFNTAFDLGKYRYKKVLGYFTRNSWAAVAIVIGSIALFGYLFQTTPSGFVPDEDQGVFFADISLPASSSLERTEEVLKEVDGVLENMEVVESRLTISGFGLLSGSGSQYGFVVGKLKHWDQREQSVNDVITTLQQKTSQIQEADFVFFSPPVISGFGNTSGFTVNLQDVSSGSFDELAEANQKLKQALSKRPEIQYASSFFETDYPQFMVNVDVPKAKRSGISPQSIMNVMQANYGGLYISNFNRFGKLYRVFVQADPEARGSTESLQNISIRNRQGEMAPISSFVDLERVYGPQSISRFNLFNSVQVSGATNPDYSSGDAIEAIEEVFSNQMSDNYSYAYSGLTREENSASGQELIIFALCLIFVYFLLSAQYESYLVPWAVILPLPIGLAGSFIFANIFGVANNIYLQISSIMLLGLLAKNAILVVEFALQRRRNEGMSIAKAAIDGAEARLRPILMTSFAFIAGLLPLALATGINANANQSIGIGTAGGMFIGTFVGLLVVPVLFIIFQNLQEKFSGPPEIIQKKREEILLP
ncbi:efflux RND transporter permease subunit [Aliifodinibius sp. S!AR15-10]|uniref:efflux RND transporter permease subunit n=1 Tax=Aliifodinibius sp. S!AR15-10 TaxID=2950437 RepID=UPI0028606F77|nr:efflux RND transporter permease subunit [Aliifodinibius sp. S!AR15-10]MDR8394030.1 efflux RND transporter permease subunit [Aliifodinibius sp. S!AR15-10]